MLTRSKTKGNEAQTSATSRSTKQLGSRHPACDSCRRSKKKCIHRHGASLTINNHANSNGIIKDTHRRGSDQGPFQGLIELHKKEEWPKGFAPNAIISHLQGLHEESRFARERLAGLIPEIHGQPTLPVSNDRQLPKPSSSPAHSNLHGSLKVANEQTKSRSKSANHNPTSEDLQETFKEIKAVINSLREISRDVRGKLEQWDETLKRHEENLKNE